VVVVRVVLECSYHSLTSYLITPSGLYRSLVLLSLLLNYKVSLFFLEVKGGRSRQSNMENTTLIRLQRIYNFLLFHAIIVSILDVLYAIICLYISFLGTNLLTQCPVPVAVFCLFLPFQKIIVKRSPNEEKTLD
jgi:hypothetical protein